MAGRRYRVEGGDLCAANEEKEEELLLLLLLLPPALVAGVARGCVEDAAAEGAAATAAAAETAPREDSAAGLEAAAAVGTMTPPGLFPPDPAQAPGLATVAPSALARQSLSKVLVTKLPPPPVEEEGTVAQTGM